jgi:integrase
MNFHAPDTLLARIHQEDGIGTRLGQGTRDEYARKMSTYIKRLKEINLFPTPENVVNFFAGQVERGECVRTSARSMKAAILNWLTENGAHALAGDEDIAPFEVAYQAIRSIGTGHLPIRTQRTSGARRKAFPTESLELIERYVREHPNSRAYYGALIAFLNANLLVGLRPTEWLDVEFTEEEAEQARKAIGLKVDNAKCSRGRANGPTRTIMLYDISGQNLAKLMHFHKIIGSYQQRLLQRGVHAEEVAKKFFRSLQQSLNRILKRIRINDKLTLYSTRHQVIANAKASGLSSREIAAMFGHRSPKTARQHYAHISDAIGKTSFRPSPDSLAAVASATGIPPTPDAQTLLTAEAMLQRIRT